MIAIDKEHHECEIINFSIPYGTGVDEKKKMRRKLSRKQKEVWNMKVTLVPLVVGALDTPAKALEKRLKTIAIETKIIESQKTICLS